jgi:hypothetical protein
MNTVDDINRWMKEIRAKNPDVKTIELFGDRDIGWGSMSEIQASFEKPLIWYVTIIFDDDEVMTTASRDNPFDAVKEAARRLEKWMN